MQRADSLKKTLMLGKIEGKRRGQQRMRWLDGTADSMDMNLGKLWEMLRDREAWHAAVHWIVTSWTRLGNSTTKRFMYLKDLPGSLSCRSWTLLGWSNRTWLFRWVSLFTLIIVQTKDLQRSTFTDAIILCSSALSQSHHSQYGHRGITFPRALPLYQAPWCFKLQSWYTLPAHLDAYQLSPT